MPSSSHQEIAFSEQIRRVIEHLPEDSAEFFQRLLAEPTLDAGDLWMMVRGHLVAMREAESAEELMDGRLGKELAAASEQLLEHFAEEDSKDARLLIQAAIRYFVLNEDAEGDMDSLVGFDDDAQVFNVVVEEIGREDLAVTI